MPIGSLEYHYIVRSLHAARRTIASTSARQADITLTVDGKEVTVPQGMSPEFSQRCSKLISRVLIGSALIQACEAAGATIPR